MSSRMNMINGRPTEDASDLAAAVRYDVEQIRSEEEKAQARANLGISGSGGGGGGATVVNIVLGENGTQFDKTAGEVFEAAMTGPVIAVYSNSGRTFVNPVISAAYNSSRSSYSFSLLHDSYVASASDAYPTIEKEDEVP